MTIKKRLNLYLPGDLDEKLDKWAARLELPKSNLINLSVRAGIDAIIRTIDPTEAFTPDQWVNIIKAAAERDIEIDKEKITSHQAS